MACVALSVLASVLTVARYSCSALRLQHNLTDPSEPSSTGTVTLEGFMRIFAPRHKETQRILSTVGACPDCSPAGCFAVEFGTGSASRRCVDFDAVKRGSRLAEAHLKARRQEYELQLLNMELGVPLGSTLPSKLPKNLMIPLDNAASWSDLQKFIEAAKGPMRGHFLVLVKALNEATRPLKLMATMRFFKEIVFGSRDVHNFFKPMISRLTELFIDLKMERMESKNPAAVAFEDVIESYCSEELNPADCSAEVADIYAFYAFAFTVADKVGSILFDVCVGQNIVHDINGNNCHTLPPAELKCLDDEHMWCGHGDDPKRFQNKDWCCCSDVSNAIEVRTTLLGFGWKIKKTTERCQLHRALSLIELDDLQLATNLHQNANIFSTAEDVPARETKVQRYAKGVAVRVTGRVAIVVKDWEDGRCGVRFLDDCTTAIVMTEVLASVPPEEALVEKPCIPISVELVADKYRGQFSHPVLGSSIPLTVDVHPDKETATWTSNGKTEKVTISVSLGKIIFTEETMEGDEHPYEVAALEGSIDANGDISGVVVLDGERGGSFTLSPANK